MPAKVQKKIRSAIGRILKAKAPQARPSRARMLPIARVSVRRTQKAKIVPIKDGVSVSHTEYLSDIQTTANFNVVGQAINPGNDTLFPWLSKMSQLYENYSFQRLQFKYTPVCPTTTPGSISLVTDFDCLDSLPGTKIQMRSYSGCAKTQVSNELVYQIPFSQLHKQKMYFVRSLGELPAGADRKTYDMGTLIIGTDLGPVTQVPAGEVEVSYVINFLTPQLAPPSASAGLYAQGSAGNELADAAMDSLFGTPAAPKNSPVSAEAAPFSTIQNPTYNPYNPGAKTYSNNTAPTGGVRGIRVSIFPNSFLSTQFTLSAISGTVAINLASCLAKLGFLVYDVVSGQQLTFTSAGVASDNNLPVSDTVGYGANGTAIEQNYAILNLGLTTRLLDIVPYLATSSLNPFAFPDLTAVIQSLATVAVYKLANPSPTIRSLTKSIVYDSDQNGTDDVLQRGFEYFRWDGSAAMSAADFLGTEVYFGPTPGNVTVAGNAFTFDQVAIGDFDLHVFLVGTVLTAPTVASHTGGTNTIAYSIINTAATIASIRVSITQTAAGVFTLGFGATTVTGSSADLLARPAVQTVL